MVHNFREFKRIVGPKVKVCCVVKANAYGHSIKEAAQILNRAGAEWFGVDSLEEARLLRKAGIKIKILILGYIPLTNLALATAENFSITVYNLKILEKIVLLKLKKPIKIHLKIETGLNRQGIEEENMSEFIKFLKAHGDKFITEGISMHFANIEDTQNPSFALLQLKRFSNAVKEIEKRKVKFTLKHAAASAGAILYPQTHLNMVRVGIGLYGLYPSPQTAAKVKLRPVMTWKSVVAQIKNVDRGESVGYGRTWIAKDKTKIAVVPVGYFDGYDRKLSNCGRVIIRGKYARIVGRICMNMFMVDISCISGVKLEDEVILVGKSGCCEITVDEIAGKIGTINYEVVSRINPAISRIVK